MITFIIKSSLSLLLLYGLYWLLLRNSKLFVFNRYFLIFSVVFSLAVPFINIPLNVQQTESFGKTLITLDNNFQSVNLIQMNNNQGHNSDYNSGSAIPSFISISLILVLIYLAGLIFFLIRFMRNINKINNIVRDSEKIPHKGYRIILTCDNPGPHSFFRDVFLNREDYLNGRIDSEMLDHELEHVKQLHSIDIILIEIIKILYWFNPIFILYDRAIRINHEYLADHSVIGNNYNIKSYAEKLFSFITCSNIPLTSGSSHSFTKRRLLMMTKSRSGLVINRLRMAATVFVAAVVILILGFKVSDRQSAGPDFSEGSAATLQNAVKGIVLKKEDGKPLSLVTVVTPAGTGMQTGSDGRFGLVNVQKDALLKFSCIGYKNLTVKADFTKEMVITMEKDPDYKGSAMTPDARYIHEGEYVTIKVTDDSLNRALLVIDGEVKDYKGEIKLKRDDIGPGKVLRGKEAIEKYGEKGKYGVVEIMSKKRADELGIKSPEPKPSRMSPEDYPTFQGKSFETFSDWVIRNLKYPDEAKKKKIQGRINVNFNVDADGSVSNVVCVGFPDPILKDAVIKAVQNSPKWEPSKNPAFNKPMPLQISIKFELPDKVLKDDALNYVEEMPSYPGGEEALLKFIYDNLRYPAEAKANKIQGRVIVRFVVNKEGNLEDAIVIKGFHPLLDAEALRVIRMLSGWKPAMHAGSPVNANYMIPVTFSLK